MIQIKKKAKQKMMIISTTLFTNPKTKINKKIRKIKGKWQVNLNYSKWKNITNRRMNRKIRRGR